MKKVFQEMRATSHAREVFPCQEEKLNTTSSPFSNVINFSGEASQNLVYSSLPYLFVSPFTLISD